MKIKILLSKTIWKFQRFRRGWADCDAYNIDYWFLRNLAPMLGKLIKDGRYVPNSFKKEEWIGILKEMRRNLLMMDENFCEKAYRKIVDIPSEEILNPYHWDEITKAMETAKERFFKLFSKYFFDMLG